LRLVRCEASDADENGLHGQRNYPASLVRRACDLVHGGLHEGSGDFEPPRASKVAPIQSLG